MKRKTIIGLSGYRCCGKSFLRNILIKQNYPVFNTNSVNTGDSDANQITFDAVIKRYGDGRSYLLYLEKELKEFIYQYSDVLFIDSLKVKNDLIVLKEMFPDFNIIVWYLHSCFESRYQRYKNRDIDTGLRTQSLEEHDKSLENHGIWYLFKNSTLVINMDNELFDINYQIRVGLNNIKHNL